MTDAVSDPDLARALDAVEAEAFTDMVEVAPAPVRQALGLRVERRGGATLLLAPAAPIAIFNRAIGLGNDAPATEADVDAVLAAFRDAGAPAYWIHLNPVARPAELRTWLEARGLALASRPTWAKVARGTAPPPAIATPFAIGAATAEDVPALSQVIAQAHGMPPFFAAWIAAIAARPGWRAYTAREGDAVVAGGMLYQRGERAWLGMGGTLPTHRRRGAQGAIMAARVRDAIADGAAVIATETGEPVADEPNPSLDNMFRCGFTTVCSRWNFAPPTAKP